jgi:hypothetical protein
VRVSDDFIEIAILFVASAKSFRGVLGGLAWLVACPFENLER